MTNNEAFETIMTDSGRNREKDRKINWKEKRDKREERMGKNV